VNIIHSLFTSILTTCLKAYIKIFYNNNPALRTFICLILEIYLQICIQYGLPIVDLYTSYGFLHTNARTFVYKQGILLHPRSRAREFRTLTRLGYVMEGKIGE
jgi:hypothetical protein